MRVTLTDVEVSLLTGLAFALFVDAIVPLGWEAVLPLAGVNALSFLAGYLVFLAPAGLGAREGAMAVLLRPFAPAGVAAVVAMASRLWTVAAELLGALVILAVFLIYPVVNTIIISFGDRQGDGFVGLDNYEFVFTNEGMLRAIRNTAGWIVFVPLAAVSIGLAFATLADRLRRGEAIAKALIFLPMAISFVGAAVVWRLVYSFRPEGFGGNIGLLNGVKQALGMSPTPWLQVKPWNNLLLMVIMVWMQVGFAMVVLSAAIKSIPDEIIEAARIDGASEWQVFRRIMVPTIAPTIAVVTTYMVINAMKVFDIVFVIGAAETNQTEVIAERMIAWFFVSNHDGRGAAIAVVLFVAVIPVMIWNVRRFREQEAAR